MSILQSRKRRLLKLQTWKPQPVHLFIFFFFFFFFCFGFSWLSLISPQFELHSSTAHTFRTMAASEYELLELIGHGSFGQIRKIRQLSDNKVSASGGKAIAQICQSSQPGTLCRQAHHSITVY